MTALQHLIAEARGLANDHPCLAVGHQWESDGGRHCPGCPRGHTSQTVYVCARCGGYDYGEPGGPGAADCEHYCDRTRQLKGERT